MEDITDSTIFKQSYMLNLISSFHIFIILNKFRFLNNVWPQIVHSHLHQ